MQLTKRIGIIHIGTQKAPELPLRSFSIPLGKVAYTLGYYHLSIWLFGLGRLLLCFMVMCKQANLLKNQETILLVLYRLLL